MASDSVFFSILSHVEDESEWTCLSSRPSPTFLPPPCMRTSEEQPQYVAQMFRRTNDGRPMRFVTHKSGDHKKERRGNNLSGPATRGSATISVCLSLSGNCLALISLQFFYLSSGFLSLTIVKRAHLSSSPIAVPRNMGVVPLVSLFTSL